MGKKTLRKGRISKGLRPSISTAVKNTTDILTKDMNKISAWLKGQNPWITIANPANVNGEATNMPFVKVKANKLWGSPKGKSEGRGNHVI